MTHPIIADLNKRYTTKRYDATKRISAADLEVIYEALNLSASSINSQPWKFIVIESDAAKARMDKTFANKFQFNQPHVMASSHIVLLAHNPSYKREDYAKVIDKDIRINRTKPEDREAAFGAFAFAEMIADANGNNEMWTKAQTYLALGNLLHTLARLGIDSTTMEGIDSELIEQEFAAELDGHKCHVAVAMGYHDVNEDYNARAPKSRLDRQDVITVL